MADVTSVTREGSFTARWKLRRRDSGVASMSSRALSRRRCHEEAVGGAGGFVAAAGFVAGVVRQWEEWMRKVEYRIRERNEWEAIVDGLTG